MAAIAAAATWHRRTDGCAPAGHGRDLCPGANPGHIRRGGHGQPAATQKHGGAFSGRERHRKRPEHPAQRSAGWHHQQHQLHRSERLVPRQPGQRQSARHFPLQRGGVNAHDLRRRKPGLHQLCPDRPGRCRRRVAQHPDADVGQPLRWCGGLWPSIHAEPGHVGGQLVCLHPPGL